MKDIDSHSFPFIISFKGGNTNRNQWRVTILPTDCICIYLLDIKISHRRSMQLSA